MTVEGIIGKTLDKVYRVDQLQGKGGMGAVYRAHDMALNRDVAIKVMHPHFADDEEFRSRFLQEARAIAALSHPGVVQVYAVGQDLGLLYMVMDFIPGQTLHAWLRRLADENKIVALTESLAIVQQVASALHYAHQKGVLHRDIKPGNIMLKPSDPALHEVDDAQSGLELPFRPVLTDFGLAKLAEGGMHTATGTSMGTPAYMSPEQCLGLEPDPRSDVYSLGVVLFELATGRVPFDVKSLTAAIRCHTQEPPPAPRSINPSLPAEVETIVLRALAKRSEDRFANAREMALALKAAIPAIPASLTVAPTRVAGPGPYVSLMTRLAQAGVPPSVPATKAWEGAPPASLVGRALVVVAPDGQSRRIALPEKRRLTVGRTADNDLTLPEVGISRHHCHIDWDGQSWSVTDLNSTNGTFLGNSRLLPGISQPWLPNVPLRIGSHWLKFDVQAAPAAPSALGMPSASAPAGLAISVLLEPQALTIDAGQQAMGRMRILNQGVQVDHFCVSVEGLPSAWLSLPGEPLRLVPGEEGLVPLTCHAPREPQSSAGVHPFTLRILAQADPRQSAQVAGTLTINPFHELAAEMTPQQVTTGRARLRLANRGNAPTDVSIAATDPAEALRIQATPAHLTLQPGEGQTASVEAGPRKGRPWLGATKRYPFEVTAASSAGQVAKQAGLLIVRPRLPAWVPPLILLPLMALCLALGYLMLRPPVIRSVTVDPPSPLVGQPVTVRWQVDYAQSIELRPLGVSGLYPDQGEYTFERGLSGSTNLSVVALGRFGLASAEQPVTIPVVTPTPTPIPEPLDPIVEGWSVSPTEVVVGQVVTIKWQVSNAESVTLQPFGTVDSAGETKDRPQQTTRYVLVAVNKSKSVQKSQEVVVLAPTPTFTPRPSSPWVKAFDIEPHSFVKGQVSTLHIVWDTENADTVTIEPGIGPVGLAGNRDVPAPTQDTLFTLVAKNAGGETRSEMIVQVTEPSDLAISGVKVYMPGYTGGCIPQYGALVTQVCVVNQGAAAAGPFVVQAGGLSWNVDGLAAGQERCLESEGSASGQVVVDANNQVAESNEDNNMMYVPLPTAPPICTPTPSASISIPFVAGESGWVTEGGGVGVGPLHPQAGDFNNDVSVRGFLCFDLSGLPAGAAIYVAELKIPGDAIDVLGSPSVLGALTFQAVWYGDSLVPAAYDTPGYLLLLDAGSNWAAVGGAIDVKAGIEQALAQGYSRFQVRFAFASSTNGNGSADEFVVRIDRALPSLWISHSAP